MDNIRLMANYYQEFDADYTLDVPAEGYAGWKKAQIEIAPEHTAVVVMHAWDCGTYEEYPGWWKSVEYLPRADQICRDVMPELLSAVRASSLKLFHVVGWGDYYKELPGYKKAVELAGPEPPKLEYIQGDPVRNALRDFKAKHVFVGEHNKPDVDCGSARIGFPAATVPLDTEGVAENAHQLFGLCKHYGINHLIYTGFAINWCLLMSPGGMLDMSRRGLMCSAIKEATTACENKESARGELHKEEALWRVSIAFGFVFDLEDFLESLKGTSR